MVTYLKVRCFLEEAILSVVFLCFLVIPAFAAPGIKITSPGDGEIVRPGDQITVVVEAIEGFVLKDGLLMLPTEENYDEDLVRLPATRSFKVPKTATGRIGIAATASDTQGENVYDKITLIIQQSSALQSLSTKPENIALPLGWDGELDSTWNDYGYIGVYGIFADGIKRSLTKAGATFLSTDPSIVSVDSEGKYKVHKVGEAKVLVSYANMTQEIPLLFVKPRGLPRSETIPPTTTINIQPEPNAEGWYNSDVTISLSATDNEGGVGVKEIEYVIRSIGKLETIKGDAALIYLGSDKKDELLSYAAVDKDGNYEKSRFLHFKLDKTMPVISITAPANTAEYILNTPITASWSAQDALSGLKSTSATVPNGVVIDTASAGQKSFNVTAEDVAGNKAEVQIAYYVRYGFGGFLAPVNPDGSSIFKLGRVIPVKFQLKDSKGSYISTATAKIYLSKISDNIVGAEVEAESPGEANIGNQFRYDPTNNQYIFNLGTESLSQGTWQIRIELDDGSSKQVNVSLK